MICSDLFGASYSTVDDVQHFGMYNMNVLLFYIYDFFCSIYCIHNHYTVTQLQHVLLGLLSVRQEPLKESVAKAAGCGSKIHLHCLPIPEDGSEMKTLILTHVDSVFYFQNFIAISRQYCAVGWEDQETR